MSLLVRRCITLITLDNDRRSKHGFIHLGIELASLVLVSVVETIGINLVLELRSCESAVELWVRPIGLSCRDQLLGLNGKVLGDTLSSGARLG